MYTPSVKKLIQEISKLPGIGEKTAERLAFHMVLNREDGKSIAQAITEMVEKTRHCEICHNFAEETPCTICSNSKRDQSLLCVVEEPKDLLALERSESYNGLYHVLMGRFAPLEKKGPENLTIAGLLRRIDSGQFLEVILATNPTMEGDGTALYLSRMLSNHKVKITRIGRGVSWGLNLSYANKASLSDALSCRQTMEGE